MSNALGRRVSAVGQDRGHGDGGASEGSPGCSGHAAGAAEAPKPGKEVIIPPWRAWRYYGFYFPWNSNLVQHSEGCNYKTFPPKYKVQTIPSAFEQTDLKRREVVPLAKDTDAARANVAPGGKRCSYGRILAAISAQSNADSQKSPETITSGNRKFLSPFPFGPSDQEYSSDNRSIAPW